MLRRQAARALTGYYAQVEQSRLDVTFIAGQELEWQVTGKNRVFLLGNFVGEHALLNAPDIFFARVAARGVNLHQS